MSLVLMYVCVHSCLQVHIVDRMTWKINYTTAHLNMCPRQIMGYIQEVLTQKTHFINRK